MNNICQIIYVKTYLVPNSAYPIVAAYLY